MCIDECKDEMFDSGSQDIIDELWEVAKSIGDVLTVDLEKLAEKVGSCFAVVGTFCIIVECTCRLN
jgi:hypothetical protein